MKLEKTVLKVYDTYPYSSVCRIALRTKSNDSVQFSCQKGQNSNCIISNSYLLFLISNYAYNSYSLFSFDVIPTPYFLLISTLYFILS